jgi:hypothetical protein
MAKNGNTDHTAHRMGDFWEVGEKQPPAAGLVEKRGQKLQPGAETPGEMTARLKVPIELSVLPGELSRVEQLLAPGHTLMSLFCDERHLMGAKKIMKRSHP